MTVTRRDVMALSLAACAPMLWAQTAPWPNKPIRLIVVYPPGGVSDSMARALALELQASLGVPVLVDNRPGAGGSVGIDLLGRAPPDGYTLAFSAISPLTLQPANTKSSADPAARVAPVASVMRTPVLVVGTPAFTGRDFSDVITQARQRPGALRWATSGRATVGHLVLAQVRRLSGVDITHVPYQGGGQQLNDALGGQFELLSTNVAALQLQYVAEGRLTPLAVGAPTRLKALPDVPTLAELGFAAANLESLFGVFAPAPTPAAIVAALNLAINQALSASPSRVTSATPAHDYLRERLQRAYNLPAGGSAASFAQDIATDRARHLELLNAAHGLLD